MKNKTNYLYLWLKENGFSKEAYLLKEAIGGGAFTLGGASSLEESKRWNDKNLAGIDPFDPANRKEALEQIHLILDLAGLFPGVGEPADLVNAVLYTITEKTNSFQNKFVTGLA